MSSWYPLRSAVAGWRRGFPRGSWDSISRAISKVTIVVSTCNPN